MPKPVYLLSDLHLPVGASALRKTFLAFLEGPARSASEIYILGDLFEYWVGDDAGLEHYRAEVHALRSLHDAGVKVSFQHGNRDFLVGRTFADTAGVTLLPETQTVELGGERVLLAHGDQYCTADRGYQRWRGFSRNYPIQFLFGCLPRSLRARIGGGVRRRSSAQKSTLAMDIMDVSEDAIRAQFEESGVDRIIHGHTHRPADHAYDIGGRPRIRTVLADWRPDYCEVLRADDSGFTRVPLSLASSD